MSRLPFLRGFLRTLVGLHDSSRGYAIRALRAELLRLCPSAPRPDAEAAVAALVPR